MTPCSRSPAATLGYYKAPELTAELFTADGWLKTGDKGVIDANNRLTIVGRIKDNFKTSKGKYVAPAPIEHKLSQHDAIDACLVVGSSMSQPLGLIVLNEVAARDLGQNKAKLMTEFSEHLDAINATLDAHETPERKGYREALAKIAGGEDAAKKLNEENNALVADSLVTYSHTHP